VLIFLLSSLKNSQEVEFLTEIDDIFTIDIHEPINSKYDNANFNTAYEDYPQHQEIDLNFKFRRGVSSTAHKKLQTRLSNWKFLSIDPTLKKCEKKTFVKGLKLLLLLNKEAFKKKLCY
jgi:hypothetical protein